MKTRTVTILSIILIISNVIWGVAYFSLKNVYETEKAFAQSVSTNTKVISFLKLFTRDLLEAQGEIDFETRLALENAVRDIDDAEIMLLWKNFIASPTEKSAQDNVSKLLAGLISKIEK